MNKWLEIVSNAVERHFGFLRDDFGFTIEIPKHSSTETTVKFWKHQATIELFLFTMPIEDSSPWLLIRSTTQPKSRTVNLDQLIKIRCPQFCLSAPEKKRDEGTVWQSYSLVLRTQFADLLQGAVTLDEVVTDSI